MPRTKKTQKKTNRFDPSSLIAASRSYTNLAYGALTVLILFIIIFLGLRAIVQRDGEVTQEATNVVEMQTYEVKEGDTLWSISENFYKDGYKWTEIAQENNIKNPGDIEKGTKLMIPEVDEVAPTAVVTEAPVAPVAMDQEAKITANSYTVVEADNLWTIAVRAYGDGYKWSEVAKANKLVNPDLIYVGTKIQLPR